MNSRDLDDTRLLLKTIEASVGRMWPAVSGELAGKKPDVQAAILADLTATWLAGNIVPDDATETRKVRNQLLREYTKYVRDLIPFHEPPRARVQ